MRIGMCEQDEVDHNGHLLAEWCEAWSLTPMNTHFNVGGTFWAEKGNSAKRIDFVGGSMRMKDVTESCTVYNYSGDRLQLAGTARRLDHRPVGWKYRSAHLLPSTKIKRDGILTGLCWEFRRSRSNSWRGSGSPSLGLAPTWLPTSMEK